jgi:hypothetical protein
LLRKYLGTIAKPVQAISALDAGWPWSYGVLGAQIHQRCMSERVRPAFPHAAIQREGPWSWGCPQGISVDAAPEPNADYPVTEVV